MFFSPEEHAAIQKALHQKLGPEYISQRPGANGQKVLHCILESVLDSDCLQSPPFLSKDNQSAPMKQCDASDASSQARPGEGWVEKKRRD